MWLVLDKICNVYYVLTWQLLLATAGLEILSTNLKKQPFSSVVDSEVDVVVDFVVDVVVDSVVDSVADVVPADTSESSVLIIHIVQGHGMVLPGHVMTLQSLRNTFPYFIVSLNHQNFLDMFKPIIMFYYTLNSTLDMSGITPQGSCTCVHKTRRSYSHTGVHIIRKPYMCSYNKEVIHVFI